MTRKPTWQLLVVPALGVWLAAFGSACSHGEKARLGTADFASRFNASRDKAKDLEYPGLLSKLGIKTTKDQQLPFDPTAIRYFAEADKALGLVDAERRAFKQNGFVLPPTERSMVYPAKQPQPPRPPQPAAQPQPADPPQPDGLELGE